ncbi:MAG: hypothetical protein DKT66_22565 [Candidatus Melainabacteria bacterium]|nr:MAG: hypothetical protein DKT66_22565 [Candidatus Melainabacteria bacterium]
MKRKQFVTGAVFAAAVLFPLAAWSQYNTNFVSVGTSTLPAGQYLMSNLATGQSLFVIVSPQGQMTAQDPRAVQVSLGASAVAPIGAAPTQPGMPGTNPTGGGGFGGLLKQGLDTFIQNKFTAPQGQ